MNNANLQYCTQCGHLVAKVAPRCPKCGAPPYNQPPHYTPPKIPHWVYWASAVIGVLIIVSALSSPDKTTPSSQSGSNSGPAAQPTPVGSDKRPTAVSCLC